MKEIKNVKSGKNYNVINIGKMNEIKDYELVLGDITIPGKVFLGQALGTTGCELSFNSIAPNQDSGFLHNHKTHEELYFILKGEGVYQVDGDQTKINEGSIIRVSPKGERALKNTGNEDMIMLCIQYKANSFNESDSPMIDAVILNEKLEWSESK